MGKTQNYYCCFCRNYLFTIPQENSDDRKLIFGIMVGSHVNLVNKTGCLLKIKTSNMRRCHYCAHRLYTIITVVVNGVNEKKTNNRSEFSDVGKSNCQRTHVGVCV